MFASADPARAGAQWTQLYFGMGFTAFGSLLLEQSVERMLSVIFAPAFAWAVMLFALCGLAVGGLFSHTITRRSGNLSVELGRLTFLIQVAIVLLLWFLTSRHGSPGLNGFLAAGFACGVPFFFAGTVLATASAEAAERTHRAYAYLFSFAAVPCLLLVPFLRLFGGPNTVLTAAVVFGIASAIWFNRGGDGNLRALGALVALMLVALIGINGVNHVFDTHWSLDEELGAERFAQWNTYSRIALREDQPVVTWDGLPYAYTELQEGPDQEVLAEYATTRLRPGGDVLVIGGLPGVMAAARSGASSITVVERNPTVSRRILQPNDDWPGVDQVRGVDSDVDLEVITQNERSFLVEADTDSQYDVIQISLPIDLGLVTEKRGLLTAEGIGAALDRLKPDGILSLSLPSQLSQTMEIAAVAQRLAGRSTGGVLYLWDARGTTNRRETLLISERNWFSELVELGLGPVLLAPVVAEAPEPTDDLPYPAYLQPAEELVTEMLLRTQDRSVLLRGYAMHLLFVPGVAVLLLVTLGAAWFVLRRSGPPPMEAGSLTSLLWITAAGLGAGLAMASLLARWGPLVRNPTYLLTVALCLFLLGASLAAQRANLLLALGRTVPVVLAVLGPVVLGWGGSWAGANFVLEAGAVSAFREIAMMAALVIPAGAAFGVAIPSAMGHFRKAVTAGPVWALLAAAVVAGMTFALPVSMLLGLTAAVWIGAALLGAALMVQALGWVFAHPAVAVA